MRYELVLALLASLSLAACGGSTSSSSSSAASPSPSTTPSSAAPAPATTTTAAPTTNTAASSSSAASSAAKAPDTNVRLPAKFTIRSGGALTPPVIAAPKHTEVALTIASGDGKLHTVVLDTPRRYRLVVHPGSPSKLVLRGVPNGTYAVLVDGARKGQLVIGAAPGP